MPSQMQNFRNRLTLKWSDFAGTPPAARLKNVAAKPDKSNVLAQTDSNFTVAFGAGNAAAATPTVVAATGGMSLADDVTVTINFRRNNSWKIIDHLSDEGKEFLLDHEQGHYNISALVGRDCFYALMEMKSQVLADRAAGVAAAQGVVTDYTNMLRSIQDTYDWETNHGEWTTFSSGMFRDRKGTDQTKWEGFINQAFLTERAPQVLSPDGIPWKKRLKDVLVGAGVTLR